MEKNILKTAGFKVTTAMNGIEGMEKLIHDAVDIIITDIEMPKMDGIEFIKKIRNHNKTVPILVLSSINQEATKEICLNLGANDFLHKKDFAESIFIEKIKSYFK